MPTKNGKKRKRKERVASTPEAYAVDIGSNILREKGECNHEKNKFKIKVTKDEKRRRNDRQARFATTAVAAAPVISQEDEFLGALSAPRRDPMNGKKAKEKRSDDDDDRRKPLSSKEAFVGTSQALEKEYLRLTTFPRADQVRPLEVLQKSLEHIKRKYKQEEDFQWASNQLKSVRQDLTVQGIREAFVLDVYETHARLLLEHGDLNEFNQCQSMIKTLTSNTTTPTTTTTMNDEDSPGLVRDGYDGCTSSEAPVLEQSRGCADEFAAYRILYSLVQKSSGDLINSVAAGGDIGSSRNHALRVAKAVIHNDYCSFFRLYHSAPNMSAYLMDFLLNRVRSGGYKSLLAAHRPTLTVGFFQKALDFRDDEETRQFLKKNRVVFVEKKGLRVTVDCKASSSIR